jgi:hypothetical protein
LERFSLTNTSSYLRTVYFIENELLFLPHYNKTDKLTQKEKFIARFLCEEASNLVLEDIIFLRPIAAFFNTKFNKNKNNIYMTKMFVKNGNLMTKDNIREVFKSQSEKYFNYSLLFSEYRQLSIYYFKENFLINMNEEGMFSFFYINY